MIPLLLRIRTPRWNDLYTIPVGTVLIKGRHGLYSEMVGAMASVELHFGCYSWASDPDTIHYCGSFSKDYAKDEFKTNLHGRMHNYLQNHRTYKSGVRNTNLMVFNNINSCISETEVRFQYLEFESVEIGNAVVSYDDYCQDPNLVKAVEQLLISSYRRLGQCEWNRS